MNFTELFNEMSEEILGNNDNAARKICTINQKHCRESQNHVDRCRKRLSGVSVENSFASRFVIMARVAIDVFII